MVGAMSSGQPLVNADRFKNLICNCTGRGEWVKVSFEFVGVGMGKTTYCPQYLK
jgi:hypothetical protein